MGRRGRDVLEDLDETFALLTEIKGNGRIPSSRHRKILIMRVDFMIGVDLHRIETPMFNPEVMD